MTIDAANLAIAATVALAGVLAWAIAASVRWGRLLADVSTIKRDVQGLASRFAAHEDLSRAVQSDHSKEITIVSQRVSAIEGRLQPRGADT